MREAFSEWYYPSDDEIAHIVRAGTIALDANVLLDLYRVGSDRREEILETLQEIGSRLFLPYQAAHEYQRNRLKALNDARGTFDKIVDDLDTAAQKALATALQDVRDKAVRSEITIAFDASFDQFKRKFSNVRDNHILDADEARVNDPVRDQLDLILRGKCLGKRPDEEQLSERREEGLKRISEGRPPGFADGKKSADGKDPTGDYLIWAELLDHASETKRPILFVTNDSTKDDWYLVVRGKTIGPLPELVAEMAYVSPRHRYHQVTLDSLLWLTNKHLGTKVSKDTINVVRDLKYASNESVSFRQAMEAADELLSGSRNAEFARTLGKARQLLDQDSLSDHERQELEAALKHHLAQRINSWQSIRPPLDHD